MPTTRVIYLEPDPCLRRFMTTFLADCEEVEIVATVGSADEVLALDLSHVDVVLLEMSLGLWSVSGFEVALELRRRKSLGIVFFTHHAVPDISTAVPAKHRNGWSIVHKASDLDAPRFSQILRSTARGLNIVDPISQRDQLRRTSGSLDKLTERQRQILSLAAGGMDGNAIAEDLGLAAVTVRQDLSRIYSVLVPDAGPGRDLRTTAVVRYLQNLHGSSARDFEQTLVTSAM